MATTPTKKINIVIYFKNLTTRLRVLNVLNMHIKLYVNYMLFTIQSIKLFFMLNFRLQKLEI